MLYTLRVNHPEEKPVDIGVYESFDDALKVKFFNECIVPVEDEKARSLILGSIYDQVSIEYSEKGLDECDEYGELQSTMFDEEVEDYIRNKRAGWELLLGYDYEKDNYFVG